MQSLDIFRWVLTGGDRAVDTTTSTILEKTRHSGQGGSGIFPDKELSGSATVREVSPFRWNRVTTTVQGQGTAVYFSDTEANTTPSGVTNYNGTYNVSSTSGGNAVFYRVYIRVKACDSTIGVESNCKQYGTNYKPEGLMQKYAMQLRYGALGYLNDGNLHRDGGVLRARLKAVGPQTPVPGSTPVDEHQRRVEQHDRHLRDEPRPYRRHSHYHRHDVGGLHGDRQPERRHQLPEPLRQAGRHRLQGL